MSTNYERETNKQFEEIRVKSITNKPGFSELPMAWKQDLLDMDPEDTIIVSRNARKIPRPKAPR